MHAAQACASSAQAEGPKWNQRPYRGVPVVDFLGENAHVQNEGEIPLRSSGVLSLGGSGDAQGVPKAQAAAQIGPQGLETTPWERQEPCWLSRGDAQGVPKGPSGRPERTTGRNKNHAGCREGTRRAPSSVQAGAQRGPQGLEMISWERQNGSTWPLFVKAILVFPVSF